MSLFFFKAPLLTSEGVKLAKKERFPGGGEEDEVSKVNMGQTKELGFVPGICLGFFLRPFFLMSCK